MAKDYIIQKAVEFDKINKKGRKTQDEYAREYWWFRKYDGCCAVLKDGKTFSRTGEEYQCLNAVARYLQDNYPDHVFIGEVWWPGKGEFNKISGAFRRQEENDQLLFVMHDVIPREDFDAGFCAVPFLDRVRENPCGDGEFGGRIREQVVARYYAAGLDETGSHHPNWGATQQVCNHWVAQGGYDGIVGRNPNGHWEVGAGKNGDILKVKQKLSFDLKVLEINTVTGEKTGRDVHKLVVDFRGQRLGVGSGVPHVLPEGLVAGAIVEVEAMDYSSDGLLREPRYKGVRFDKLAAD